MVKGNKSFSAFKLFYDELIYKKSTSISYYKIERNINKIKEIVHCVLKTPISDEKYYMIKLERNHKRIKNQLDEIYALNKNVFEFYYLLYKTKDELCNDKVEDMPFVIACSFYEDYRIDGKEKDEIKNNLIPKYSSKEKKEIRDKAKKMTSFEYFVSLIEEINNDIFNKFIEKAKCVMALKPYNDETADQFMARISKILYEFSHIYKRLFDKVQKVGCLSLITEKMFIAYKIKFESWNEQIKDMVIEHFKLVYKRENSEKEARILFSSNNSFTYEEYIKIVDKLCDEKNKYITDFELGKFVPLKIDNNNYEEVFKNTLINSYFDSRYNYYNNLETVNDFVNRAIDLYSLANDLVKQIFERIIFDSSHSVNLGRNNDSKSAITIRIYDLYDPRYLVLTYEKTRNEFENLLNKQSQSLKEEYKRLLDVKKFEYNYHGPIPSKEFIYAKVIEKRKKFILDYCITDLKSRDFLENYDTRNYDLLVISEEIPNNDMVSLYQQMKEKINNYDFSKLDELDIINSETEKQILLSGAQELTIKTIYRNLKIDEKSNPDIISNYRDICYGYLNEQMNFAKNMGNKLTNYHNYEIFLRERNLYNKQSKWQKFITNNKLKNNSSR